MKITKAEFIQSNKSYQACVKTNKPEYAFIGRSNVGKSSLINMLTGNSKLAKTSARPGKTQLINHFLINDDWYLVDLPGYGWAKISQKERESWDKMVREYLLLRENLKCVFVLIDSRLDPQKIDVDFIRWLGENSVPFLIVFTKADKQSKSKTQANVEKFKKELLKEWEEIPEYIITSSVTNEGQEELLKTIDKINKNTYNK